MSIEDFEKREQILKLRKRVLQAEQERVDGAKTYSVSEVRKPCISPSDSVDCNRRNLGSNPLLEE